MMPRRTTRWKVGAVVGARPGQLDEIADVIGREVGPQVDDERPGGRRDDGLFAGHLGFRQRRRKRDRRLWRLPETMSNSRSTALNTAFNIDMW